MKENNIKRTNFAILVLFPVILLIFAIICNLYNIGINNSISRELDNFTNSLSDRMEDRYMEIVSLYFGNELLDYNKAREITNLVEEQVRLGLTPSFNSLKFSINNLLNNSMLNIIYIALFLIVLMFILIIFIIFNNNANNPNNKVLSVKNNDYKHAENQEPKIQEENKSPSIILKSEDDKNSEEIKNMYQNLVAEIKNSKDEKALEILENIFSIDERNYLALNGAGILYTKMYSKNNKSLYFKKADKYYESAISIYDNKDILNNKAVLYSTRYGIEKSNDDYNKALTIFDNMIYSNGSDFDLLNNRATIYLSKYGITGSNELFEKALKDYDELIELDHGNIYALNNRSVLYFDKYKRTNDNKYFEKSIEDCNTAFKINPNEAMSNTSGLSYIYKY